MVWNFIRNFFREVSDKDDQIKDLEYIIYKHFDLNDNPESLRERLFTVAPIVPGQQFDEKFHYPAFKKPAHNWVPIPYLIIKWII